MSTLTVAGCCRLYRLAALQLTVIYIIYINKTISVSCVCVGKHNLCATIICSLGGLSTMAMLHGNVFSLTNITVSS